MTDPFDTLLRHALRTAPMPASPAGFAQAMAQKLSAPAEEAGVEIWLTRIALGVVAISIPVAGFTSLRLHTLLGEAPWPLLLMTIAVFGGVKLLDVVPLYTERFR